MSNTKIKLKKKYYISLSLIFCTCLCLAQNSYKYDAVNRLTQISSKCGGTIYTYDKNGNRKTLTTVTIDLAGTKTDETCNKQGSITLTPSNQDAQYSYQWNTGQITPAITNLKAGLYKVVITDKPTGITCQREFTIASAFKDSIAVVSTNILCNGVNDGKAKIKIVTPNPQGSYVYKWSSLSDTTYRSLDSLNNLKAGNYSVNIKNIINGCIKTVDFLIAEPSIFVTGISKTDVSCSSKADGVAKVEVLGDPTNYTFKWTGVFSGERTTQQISGLTTGNYSVTVIEKSTLCSITKNVIIDQFFKSFIAVPSGATTFNKGKNVQLHATTGTGYTYSWLRNAIPIPLATTASYSATESGSYTVNVSYNGCSILSQPIIVTVLDIDNFSILATAETCRTSNNGSIKILAKQPLNYIVELTPSKSTTPLKFSNEIELKNLSAGKYTVCVSVEGQVDFKQCYDVVITEPKDLNVYSMVNTAEKLLTLTLSGGTEYVIEQNGKKFITTKDKFVLTLSQGINTVRVNTDNLCQGIFEETFTLSKDIIIYPNPFERKLHISLGNNKSLNSKVTIRNITGNIVFTKLVPDNHGIIDLDLPELAAGIYTLQLNIGSSLTIYKIMKK